MTRILTRLGLVGRRVLPTLLVAATLVLGGLLATWPGWTGLDTITAPPLYAQGYSNTSAYAYWVSPGACNTTVLATASAGSNGPVTIAASSLPVVQSSTAATGTQIATFVCNISPPYSVITGGNGLAVTDAVFFYSPQSGLGTQAAVLASGTFNAQTVFSAITYPTAATGETASTLAPVRADTGTLTILPTTTNFNVTTLTAGQFFSVKFTPSAAIAWATDLKQLLLTVAFQQVAGTPTVITSPGVLVHFRGQ